MCYIHSCKHLRMFGWVGDDLHGIEPHLYADADYAGCTMTQRSTTGAHMCARGPRTYYPLGGTSKRQSCVSHSTPEAEMVAMDFALRQHGLPTLSLFDACFERSMTLRVHEDNKAMMQVCSHGKNPL